MDIFPFLLEGCIVGLAFAAPMGPVGVICIRKSLTQGTGTDFFPAWEQQRPMHYTGVWPHSVLLG